MKVLGVDPGLQRSGYAVLEERSGQLHVLDAGTFTTDSHLSLAQRVNQIYEDLTALLMEHQVEVMAIEELYAHYKHPRTAILMGHARGVLLLAAAQKGIEVVDFAATRVKKSLTGNGHASKEQVQLAVMQQLNLPQLPSPPDVADAIAIAMCCMNHYSRENVSL